MDVSSSLKKDVEAATLGVKKASFSNIDMSIEKLSELLKYNKEEIKDTLSQEDIIITIENGSLKISREDGDPQISLLRIDVEKNDSKTVIGSDLISEMVFLDFLEKFSDIYEGEIDLYNENSIENYYNISGIEDNKSNNDNDFKNDSALVKVLKVCAIGALGLSMFKGCEALNTGDKEIKDFEIKKTTQLAMPGIICKVNKAKLEELRK